MGGYLLVIKSLPICSVFHESTLQRYTWLHVGPFIVCYQISWHAFVPNTFNDPFYFCGVTYNAFLFALDSV